MSCPRITFRKSAIKDFETLCAFTKDAEYDNGRNLNWAVFDKYPQLKEKFEKEWCYKMKNKKELRRFIQERYCVKKTIMNHALSQHRKRWEKIAPDYFLLINISAIINTAQDAWNWWHACNKVSYGVDWKKRIPLTMQKKIVGKSRAVAYKFVLPHLKILYKKLNITKIKNEVNELFEQKQTDIFQRMEKVTGRKLYRKTFTLFLTTFPRAPYNFKKGYIWLPIIWPQAGWLSVFAHELLHFQTYAYWEKFCLRHLTRPQFEDLKEALTIVLNEEFLDLIVWRDKGYECHKKMRMKLRKYWQENKNFDKLVRFGIEIMTKNSSR